MCIHIYIYIYSFTLTCKTQPPNTLSIPDMPYEFQRRLPLQQSESNSSNPSTMAASAPPRHLAAGWVKQSSEDDGGSKDLELKMSGMSLMTNYNNGAPGMSCSTVSTSSVDGERPQPQDSSIDHSAAGSFKGSTPSSPNPVIIGHSGPGLSRPPGLGGHLPSPIGTGPGHSKNSSATSPVLTLTPNSSVDGNSDLYSLGGNRQQSPFQTGENGPAMPFLRSEGRRSDEAGEYGGMNTFGSFDLADSDNDGLLGLDALRDRAYSSPGPMARSFESAPSLRGSHLPPPRMSDVGSEGRRLRGVSRDNSGRSSNSARPPLSGGNAAHSPRGEPVLSNNGDMSLGGLVVPLPVNGSRSSDPSPTRPSQQELDPRGFGAIGRPELTGNAQEWEPLSRRRSIAGTSDGTGHGRPDYSRYGDDGYHDYEQSRRRSIGSFDGGREYYQYNDGSGQQQQQPVMDPMIAQKFGSMPSLNAHLQQQRMVQQQQQHQPYNPMMIPQPRHQRSFSQPGPGRIATPPDNIGMEGGSVGRYPGSDESGHYPPTRIQEPPRYIGAPPPQPPHHARTPSGDSFRSVGSRKSASMSHGSLSHNSYDGAGNMPIQKRNSQPSLGSGYYGQPSLPSMSQAVPRMVQPDHDHQRRHTYDDDLAGSLMGEHIEVPADHALYDGFYPGQGLEDALRPQVVPPEQLSPPFGFDAARAHLPTAGAALPSPRVVYNVKFKRTQRSFVLGPRIQRDLKVGTYVKVEADRGEDLGIVIGKVPAEKYAFSGRPSFRSPNDIMPSPTGLNPPGATDLKCIIRLATHDEVSLLAMKREEEEELLKICRGKVRQRALPMNVVDAEYQFDRHKLTFFFEAECRIDFRELVRDLFSMYKTRIWMQQLDKNNASTAGGTGMQPPPSTMIDYGTPIIAPASEFSDAFMNSVTGRN